MNKISGPSQNKWIILALLALLSGCAGLNANKNFPPDARQKFVDKFVYFQNNGFGGYYRFHSSMEAQKGKWGGKMIALFLPNVPAEYPSIISEFHDFPEDWKAKSFEEVDTLVLLEFRGGVQEKLLNQTPKDLRLVMKIVDTKNKTILRTIKIKTWPPGTERRSIQKNLPSIKETLEKRRKNS